MNSLNRDTVVILLIFSQYLSVYFLIEKINFV